MKWGWRCSLKANKSDVKLLYYNLWNFKNLFYMNTWLFYSCTPADWIFTFSYFNLPRDWLCICKSRIMWGYHSIVIECFNRFMTGCDEYILHLNIYCFYVFTAIVRKLIEIYVDDFSAIGMHTFIFYSIILNFFLPLFKFM